MDDLLILIVSLVFCLLLAKTVAYSKMPTNLQQHLQNEHPAEFADVVRSEDHLSRTLLTVLQAV